MCNGAADVSLGRTFTDNAGDLAGNVSFDVFLASLGSFTIIHSRLQMLRAWLWLVWKYRDTADFRLFR